MTNNNQTTLPSFRPRRISWLTIVLAFLAVVTFFMIARVSTQYAIPMGEIGYSGKSVGVPPEATGIPMRDNSVSSTSPQGMMKPGGYYPYYNPNVPVTDTREFLKVSYNSSMRTRDVQSLTRRVETTVRGYDGRIDQESSSPQSGYVSFVVPMSKYNAFRTELEGLVGARFLTVNISSQNLLPQKQSIEEQQKQADTTLAGYKTARQNLVNAHSSTIKSFQAQIDSNEQQLTNLRAQTQTPEIQSQIQALMMSVSGLKQQLTSENASYSLQLSKADSNIKYAQDWQTAVKTQDQTLLDNVATVTGTVSIQWISLWEIALLYLPGYWIPAIFAILAFFSLLWDRRRFGTV